MAQQTLFDGAQDTALTQNFVADRNIITDKGSKYSVCAGVVTLSKDNLKTWLHKNLADKFFQKATHNTYAYRFYDEEGFIIEGKDDDGETGAGKIVLDYMQRANLMNAVIVVTRYYGGVQLHADRFRHVVSATQHVLDNYIS